MECPDCGYIMTAFDLDCARCKKYGKPVAAPLKHAPVAAKDNHCSNCGLLNDPRAEDCRQCHAPMSGPTPLTNNAPAPPPADVPTAQAAATCSNCNGPLRAGQSFCQNCGFRFPSPVPLPGEAPALPAMRQQSNFNPWNVVRFFAMIIGPCIIVGVIFASCAKLTAPKPPNPTLTSKMEALKTTYRGIGINVEWPYMSGDSTLRATIHDDLGESEDQKLADLIAKDFRSAHRDAGDDTSCMIFLYDDTGKRLASASS